jgi:hypothetical protein
LYPIANRDVVYVFDDFIGGNNQEPTATDWNESIFNAKVNNAGTAFVPAGTQLVNGVIAGATGAYAEDTTSFFTDLMWSGDNRCGMEARLKVDTIDGSEWEIGFNNSITAVEEPIVGDIDTPSYDDGDDLALIAQQAEATLETLAFVTDGSTTSMNATKTNLGTRNMVNDTYFTFRVQLDGDQSFAYIFDENGGLLEHAAHGGTIGEQVEGATLLQSRLCWEAEGNATRNISIDYWGIWQDRLV